MGKLIDLTGKRFGRLTVIARDGSDKKRNVMWLCACACGQTKAVAGSRLRNGTTKSCGCMVTEKTAILNYRHGGCKKGNRERLYTVWYKMLNRTNDPNDKSFLHYGGRGIQVCEEWRKNYAEFRRWAIANGYDEKAPFGECSLERIDNDGDYTPENCRWATYREQSRNTRRNRHLTFNGKTMIVNDWAAETGIASCTIRRRIDHYGWTVGQALTTPVRK